MGDVTRENSTSPVQIIDPSTGLTPKVSNVAGTNRMATDSLVTVEELLGRDPQATTYFYIGTADDAIALTAGDTIRVQIPAGTGTNASQYPAVDVTTTVTASMVSDPFPEIALANQIVSDLNGDSNFTTAEWKAQRIKDFSGVFINSKLFNEFGERTSWTLTTTGTLTATQGFTDILRRGFETELARSPNDPRKGILAISGTVQTIPGAISDRFVEFARDNGSDNLRVNGSVTPKVFQINPVANQDRFVTEVRFVANANGIKFAQFLSIATLTNGIQIEIKSDDLIFDFSGRRIFKTDDFKHWFARGGYNFEFHVQAGADDMVSSLFFAQPLVLRPTGTFTTDDYIKVTINDDLTHNSIKTLHFIAFGFDKEV